MKDGQRTFDISPTTFTSGDEVGRWSLSPRWEPILQNRCSKLNPKETPAQIFPVISAKDLRTPFLRKVACLALTDTVQSQKLSTPYMDCYSPSICASISIFDF